MLTKLLDIFFPEARFTLLWHNKRFRAIILFSFWILFLASIYFILIMPSYNSMENNSEKENKKVETLTYDDVKNKLLNYNFNFTLMIEENNSKVLYNGNFANLDSASFYKEDVNGIKKYILKDSIYYEIILEQEIEINFDDSIFNLKNIFNKLETIDPDESENAFIFANDEVYGKILIEDSNISQIEYRENNINYLYKFTNIN